MAKLKRRRTEVKTITHGKRKKWAKGHSSDSNPVTRIHRDAAKNQFYFPQNTDKELKFQDLKMLENMDLNLKDDDDRGSVNTVSEADTVATKLSAITNCTNPTFDKVHRIWKSGSKLHTDILTVLASVTDAIKSKGGKENEVEYFAALLNPLVDPTYSSNFVAAACYLLNLVIRKVPKPILVQQFRRVAEIIYGVVKRAQDLPEEEGGHQTSILRYSISSLGVLLEAHPSSVWSSQCHGISMVKILETILEFVVHKKPRVRKAAQKAIVQIIINRVQTPTAVSNSCADYCIQIMERYNGGGKGKRHEAEATLHVLNILQHILHRFISADLKRTTEVTFKLMTLSDHLTASTAVHCLYMMFRNRPAPASLPADLNAKIIMAVYDFQPSPNDGKAWSSWILLATEAHGCLLERDVDLASNYVPNLINAVVRCLVESENSELIASAASCMKRIYGDFAQDLVKSSRRVDVLERCLEPLEKLLQGQYYTVWPKALDLFSAFFQSVGSGVSELQNFGRSLKTIADLRESESFACKVQADLAIGAAVRYIGLETVLAAIPLGLNVETLPICAMEFPRSWLLPVLRTNICGGKLEYFSTYFLPLAINMEQVIKSLQASPDRNVEAKVLEALELQIWDLLPAFCNKPSDQLDPVTARAFGAALIGRPKLRLSILTGLRKLLQPDMDENTKKTMGKYASNYLNILLQLYIRKEEKEIADYNDDGVRLAVLQTISSYLTITPSDLITSYLDEISKRMRTDEKSLDRASDQKCRLMDILGLLVPYLDLDQRRSVYELVVETNATAEKRIQKKCWRVMEKLCDGKSEKAQSFISTNLPVLRAYLQTDLTAAAPSTRACRLRCLSSVMDSLQGTDQQDEQFILDVLPDAVKCFQGTSVKARNAAGKLMIKAATTMANWRKDMGASLSLIMEKIMAPYDQEIGEKIDKGSKLGVQELADSIIAARLLCYEFRNDISTDVISSLLGRVCRLIRDDDRRSIVHACVEFLKTFVGCYPEITVGQFLDTIVASLCNQNDDCMKYSRRVTRKVMAKLVKRFSYVTVRKYVPEKYEKQLNNIRKLVARSERKTGSEKNKSHTRSVASSVDDETGTVFTTFTHLSRPDTITDLLRDTSDEDESGDEKEEKRHAHSVWLKDGDEDEVVDLMDKRLVQQIVTTKPKAADVAVDEVTKNRGFKTAADGRLVIAVEREEEDVKKGRKRKRQDSLDSNEGVVPDPEVGKQETQDEGTSTYIPGGRGIHRRLPEGRKRSKKAKLEKKSKNGVDPYTYVPLDKGALKKRTQAKLTKELKHLVLGARRGASKGSKGRKKQTK